MRPWSVGQAGVLLRVFAWRAGPRLQARGRIAIRIRNECIATFPSWKPYRRRRGVVMCRCHRYNCGNAYVPFLFDRQWGSSKILHVR
jgi:hypothetical protein